MKTNILIFLLILAIPFALSSQTRKAIPAGRYEALSGIKISRSGKSLDVGNFDRDSNKQIWNEVEKFFINESGEILYTNLASMEVGIRAKNIKEAQNMDLGFDLLITANLQKDKSVLKYLRGKKMVALFDTRPLDKMLNSIKDFEIITYRTEKNINFYLLKTK